MSKATTSPLPHHDEDSPSTAAPTTSTPYNGIPQMIMFAPGAGTFVMKLYSMLEDPSNSEMIVWNRNGDAFTILAPTEFSRRLLPVVYKHCQLASFIRQLNMYGFSKISMDMTSITPISESTTTDPTTTQPDQDEKSNTLHAPPKEKDRHPAEQPMIFKHALFKRGKTHLLLQIKRKTPRNRSQHTSSDNSHKRSRSRSPDHSYPNNHHVPSPYHPFLISQSPYHPMYMGSPAGLHPPSSSPASLGVYTPTMFDPQVYDTPDEQYPMVPVLVVHKLANLLARLTHLVSRTLPPESFGVAETTSLMSELHHFSASLNALPQHFSLPHHPPPHHHFPHHHHPQHPNHPHPPQLQLGPNPHPHSGLPMALMSPAVVPHPNSGYSPHSSTHGPNTHHHHMMNRSSSEMHHHHHVSHTVPEPLSYTPGSYVPSPYICDLPHSSPPHHPGDRSVVGTPHHHPPPVTPYHLPRSTLSPNIAQYTDFTPNYASEDMSEHPSRAPSSFQLGAPPTLQPITGVPDKSSVLPAMHKIPMFPTLKPPPIKEDPHHARVGNPTVPEMISPRNTPLEHLGSPYPVYNTPRFLHKPRAQSIQQHPSTHDEEMAGVTVKRQRAGSDGFNGQSVT